MLDTLFFDLDGTLIDSEPGIVNGIRHALRALGAAEPDAAVLRAWIGPPLLDMFREVFPDDPHKVQQAVDTYKARYDAIGWKEHSVYPGIAEAILALHGNGHTMALVTSKTERFARRIVDDLSFGHCFVEVVGTSEDGSRRFKPDLIAEALRRLSVPAVDCVMIGDRRMDIEGANAHGMRNIGVLWGFGAADELRTAGARVLAGAPHELLALLAA